MMPGLERNLESGEHNMYENYPLIHYGEEVRMYFLITLGYPLQLIVEQGLFQERRNDFLEMMLHHIVTIVLYTASYQINCVEVGILVVYAHDWADMFGHFGKCFAETHFKMI